MLKTLMRMALLLGALASLAFAQSEIGGASLNGTITDPSGAAIPNAKVTVSNTATGVSRSITSNEAGLYNFSRVPVGAYDLTVESNGFKTEKRTGINLTIGAVATIDIALQVGAAADVISVTAEDRKSVV